MSRTNLAQGLRSFQRSIRTNVTRTLAPELWCWLASTPQLLTLLRGTMVNRQQSVEPQTAAKATECSAAGQARLLLQSVSITDACCSVISGTTRQRRRPTFAGVCFYTLKPCATAAGNTGPCAHTISKLQWIGNGHRTLSLLNHRPTAS